MHLCEKLCVNHNVSCRYYRKRGSASYTVREVLSVREREREREIQTERDGSDVTIVALKLAMKLHFPLPKFRTFLFSLHTSRLSLRGEVTMVALKFAMSSHFPLPKFFRPQALFPLFQMARAARRVIENPRQMIKSCPVLFFFPSKKWIKLIPKTIGNRKRDCAWGGSGW